MDNQLDVYAGQMIAFSYLYHGRLAMTERVKTDTELQAWDQFAAAAISEALKATNGLSESAHVKAAAKRAAEIAEALLRERRERC